MLKFYDFHHCKTNPKDISAHFVRKITFAAKNEDGEYREKIFPQSYNYILSI